MSRFVRARLVCAALLHVCAAGSVAADPRSIDLPSALARARARAPEAVAALGRIAEAEAARAGARVRFEQNPELSAGAGPRFSSPRQLQISARLEQPLELGRRGARIDVADAELRRARAASEAQLRELAFAVETAFREARHAQLVVELMRRSEDYSRRALDAAERRRRAGDATDLDVDRAKVAHGRARAGVAAAESNRAHAIGKLALLVGAGPDEALAPVGELVPPPLALAALQAAVPARADVRVLDAEAGVATAERALAGVRGAPSVSAWLGYELDESQSIVLGGLTLTLPVWNRAQGDRAQARAKQHRVAAERAAVAGAATREIGDAYEVYLRAREAVEIFDQEAAAALVDGEQLLDRSIDAGQLAVGAYLDAREALLTARREQLDRQLALAKAAAEARYAAGVAP